MIVLGVDPGKVSGWALFDGERCIASGVARTAAERQAVCARLTRDAYLAIERHTVGGRRGRAGKGDRWNPVTILGVGAARGRWLEQAELAGVRPSRVLQPTPAEWRAISLGGMSRRSTAQAKASAMFVARGLVRRIVGPDEAEGVCIGWCGVRLVAVLESGRRAKRRRAAA